MAWLPVLISLVLFTCYYGDNVAANDVSQLPDNLTIRNQWMSAVRALSNTLHKRFHKNQKVVLYAETDVDENFVFNAVEITCTLGMLISGMSSDNDFEELGEFLGYRKLQFDFQDMYLALEQYLYSEAYNVSVGWARKIFLRTDIFTNRDFQLLDSFKSFAGSRFKSEIHDLSKLGDEMKKKEIGDFVSNRTNGYIGPFDWLSTDFDLMMSSSTYIQDLYLYSLEKTDKPLELTCTIGKKEFKLRTNTRIISTWYVDKGDRFGIIVPFRRASLSIYFYVPKTEDLFVELDEYMDYSYMTDMIEEMLSKELVRINVTFPLIDMSYSRNLTYDMQVKDVASIFLTDAVRYDNMTKTKNLVVSGIHHNTFIRMTERGFKLASMTLLTMKGVDNSLRKENEQILRDLVRKNLDIQEEPDFLNERLNNTSNRKTIGRENKSSKRPCVTTKTNRKTQISDILKGKLSTKCRKRKMKPKSKKGRKAKQLRNGKSYKPIPAPHYFETASTISLNNANKMHPDFLDDFQATTESLPNQTESKKLHNVKAYKSPAPHFESTSTLSLNSNTMYPDFPSDSKASTESMQSRTEAKQMLNEKSYKPSSPSYFERTSEVSLNSKTIHPDFLADSQASTESLQSRTEAKNDGHLTPKGTEMYARESSRKPEMSRKSIPAGVTLPGYVSKSNHRQDKALLPEDPTTKWGFFRPRFTWTGPTTSTKGYTFKEQSILSVAIKQSFFYAIVNHNTGSVFAVGKVSHCRA